MSSEKQIIRGGLAPFHPGSQSGQLFSEHRVKLFQHRAHIDMQGAWMLWERPRGKTAARGIRRRKHLLEAGISLTFQSY